MGLAVWLNLEGRDVVAFVFAGLLGFAAGRLVPPGAWAIYISILVSYHLFLGWLVMTSDRKAGVSLPVVSTIATHLAFLALILPIGIARHYIPFFGILRYCIAGLAVFERGWLFNGEESRPRTEVEVPSAAPVIAATGEDYQEWLGYLERRGPNAAKFGTSLKAEYEQWMLARSQKRTGEVAKGSGASERQ
jgi:hypothetical protein